MKVRAFSQAAPLSVLALLISCSLLPGHKEALKKALAAVADAGQGMDRTGERLEKAREGQRQAQTGFDYVEEQIRASGDMDAAGWWSSQRRDKERELHAAKLSAQRAELDHIAAGRRYFEAEGAYKKLTGRYNDPKLAEYWRQTLESGAGPAPSVTTHGEVEPWKGRLILYSLAFLGLCLIMVLTVSRKAWMPMLRRLAGSSSHPEIKVRSAAAEDKAKEMPPLAGKYKLEGVIGHGGMGRVWIGSDMRSGGQVAVKQMAVIAGVERYQVRELYLKEARCLQALQHPNIVRLLEVVDGEDGLYLVFEFVFGKTLQHILAERKRLIWPEARKVFVHVAQALGHAHGKGLVHRDIKPVNIMITDQGVVKVMDFGIAKTIGPMGTIEARRPLPEGTIGGSVDLPAPSGQGGGPVAGGTPMDIMTARTRTMAGTPSYMCPEASTGIVSPGYDIFAMGVCLYECLTGTLPFGYGGWSAGAALRYIPPAVLVTGLDRRVDTLVAGMLEADPAKRIPSCEELVRRMEEVS